MARRNNNSTSFDEQLKRLDEANARATVNQMNRNERNFSTMLDRQQEMLTNFYKASTEAGRDSIRKDMESRRQQMQEQLDAMKKSYTLYSQYMTKTERKTFQTMYKTSQDGMASIEKEMKKRFDGLEDDFDELTESFSERINRISDELRDLGTALNVNEIVQGIQDTVDSYLENLRQVRSRSGDSFDDKAFSDAIDDLNKSIGAINRAQASEVVSDIIKDFGMKKMEEVSYYAKIMASSEILGLSKDDMSNIMWKDLGMGKNGKFLRNMSNLAISLEDNQDLYVHADTILKSINDNMDAIYGLSYKDSKKQTKMVTSLSALEALSENEANEGVDAMVDKLEQWQKLTLPELMEDDTAIQFSNMMGMSLTQLQESLSDPDKLRPMIEAFQSRLSSMSDFELNMWKEELGFDYVYQLKDIIGAESLGTDIDTIVSTIKDSLNNSEVDPMLDLMSGSANETVNAIQSLKNSITSNPLVKLFEGVTDFFDVSLADAANAAILVSTGAKGIAGIAKFLSSGGGLSKLLSSGGVGKLTSLFGSGSGGFLSSLSGAVSNGVGTALSLLPAAAMSGAGIFGVFQGFNTAKSAKSEWDDDNYGRSVAYGVDTAALIGSGATTAVAGGVATSSILAGTAAGLSAIPVFGWIAAGVLALGLGTKAILDNTKKVNGFAKGLSSMGDDFKSNVNKIIGSQREQLVSIKGFLNASNGSSEDFTKAVNSLIEEGIDPEILQRMSTVEELKKFTQEMINATQSAQDFANISIGESTQEAVDELKYQFDDDKRQAFIDKSVESFLPDGSVKKGTVEWDKTQRFFDSLAATMEDGESKDEFVKAYTKAMSNHGGLSEAEMRGLLGDKGMSASWRAFWSTNLDLQDAYFDNATDYSKYNAIVDTYLGGDDSLRIDTSKIDAIKANTGTTSILDSDYFSWKNNKGTDVGDQYKYQFEKTLETLKGVQGYDEFFKDKYEGYAREMGIEGYKNGLSNVPNDGIAFLHKGEAVITSAQASFVRAKADGGLNMSGIMQNTPKELNDFLFQEVGQGQRFSIKYNTKQSLSILQQWFNKWSDFVSSSLSNSNELSRTFKDNGVFGKSSGGNSVISRFVNAFRSSGGSYSTASQGTSVFNNGVAGGGVGGSAGGTGGTAGAASQVSASDTKGKVWNFFAKKGVSAAGIAGIMGNMQAESGFNPMNMQDSYESSLGMSDSSYTQAVDNGSYSNFVNDGVGYGLVQFTYSTWKDQLLNSAKSRGKSISDIDTQLEVLWSQISDGGWFNTLKNTNDPNKASDLFLENYEKPSVFNYDARRSNANAIYNEFANKGYAVGTPWIPSDQVALIHEGEMIVPASVNPLNNPSVSVPVASSSSYDDNSDVIEVLKWMLYRLESKLDKVISSQSTSQTRRRISTEDVDNTFSFV